MDWNATWLNMANTALTRINKQVLQTLDDSSTSAMLCNQLIPQCVKMILNQNDWHSARKRALIAPQLDTPAFGYDHQFAMPSDFVRLVKVESEYPWEKEGEMILSDEEALAIIYIAYPKSAHRRHHHDASCSTAFSVPYIGQHDNEPSLSGDRAEALQGKAGRGRRRAG